MIHVWVWSSHVLKVNTHILCDPSASDVKLWQVSVHLRLVHCVFGKPMLMFLRRMVPLVTSLIAQTHLLLQNLKQTRWDHMQICSDSLSSNSLLRVLAASDASGLLDLAVVAR